MKRIILAVMVSLAFAAAGYAEQQDVVILPAKNGNVTFNHKKHVEVKKVCTLCHETEAGGKIAGMGKDWAHKTCKGCHETEKSGPTKCGDCHKK